MSVNESESERFEYGTGYEYGGGFGHDTCDKSEDGGLGNFGGFGRGYYGGNGFGSLHFTLSEIEKYVLTKHHD